MKRILYVEANEDGTVGGSHKILFDLVTRLTSGFQPLVLFYEDNIWAQRMRTLGIEVIVWDAQREEERRGLKTGSKLSTVLALRRAVAARRRLIRDLDVDLVHLNNSPFVGYDDWLPACRLAGVPCVVYAMGDARRASSPVVRFVLRRFDAYFPLSELVATALSTNGVDPARVTLTYPGVDTSEIDALTYRPRSDVRREFRLNPDQLLVAMVGNIRRWKGQHVVLESLAGLKRSDRLRLRVLFVGERGDGDAMYERQLADAIQQHHLESVVTFTGRRDDVPDLLEAADIAIHASIEPEPFGLVVQEAMLHGCATVAADAGGPVEMMSDRSGFRFDPAHPEQLTHHLRSLLGDAELIESTAERARTQARRFDVHEHVALIEARYHQLLGT